MPPNFRQGLVYNHSCDIYSVTRTTNTDGKGTPGNETITKVGSSICHYEYTPNVDDPTGVGRVKRMTILTTDIIHLPVDVTIENGWWVRNTTSGANFGQVHKVLGASRAIPGSSRRPANKQSVMAMQEEHPPAEIA